MWKLEEYWTTPPDFSSPEKQQALRELDDLL